mgnify:CR=1 FL=1
MLRARVTLPSEFLSCGIWLILICENIPLIHAHIYRRDVMNQERFVLGKIVFRQAVNLTLCYVPVLLRVVVNS